MKILRHRLHHDDSSPYEWRPSPNRGSRLEPEYLVMHYTAGPGLQQSVDWLTSRQSRASAHVVIGRDGTIVQLVSFDTVAWHAGASSWEGRTGMNQWSIGIELDNAGKLMRHGTGWRAWFGDVYGPEDVIEATHKHESSPAGWHVYPPVQLDAALELSSLLVERYGLLDVVGHDDISPGRKTDPGPAFPMASFRSRVFGRREDAPPLYRTITILNIRSGPGTQHATIPGSPLPAGTRVDVVRQQDAWRLVDVLDPVDGLSDVRGWVHYRFLERATAPAATIADPMPVES